ncbi:MAG: N-acetylneuraminate synthase [Desulfobacteraceae bacterium]|jgi:N-acetylneuraminate synthase/N,N'-diacetyllegionaminate synthase
MDPVDLGGKKIGPGHPCFVIAEAGVNHNGDVEAAEQLVMAAVEAGADAVKFQTFRASSLVTRSAPKADYQEKSTGSGSQWDMLRGLELPEAAWKEIKTHCEKAGILFLSSVFDEQGIDLLEGLDVAAYKLGSGELTNDSLLRYAAQKRKPLILSTGMSTLDEVSEAVEIVREAGAREIVLLHCVSCYPADPEDANLRAMETLRQAFDVPVGFSDHTVGTEVAFAAVALGATVIEKHFTLDRTLPGPDHKASLEPRELEALIHGIRRVERALGHGRKEPVPAEEDIAKAARRSIVAAEDIPSGTRIREKALAFRRPGTGLAPAERQQLVGRRARTDIPAGTLISMEMVE